MATLKFSSIACILAILSSCTDSPTNEAAKEVIKTLKQQETPKPDTSDILMKMSIRRIELIMQAKSDEENAHDAAYEYGLDGTAANLKKAKAARRKYERSYYEYDSLDKAMRILYAIYYKKEMEKPTKFY